MLQSFGPGTYFLQWIRTIFTFKKSALFGSILAPFWTLMFPKPYFLQYKTMIFEVSFWAPELRKKVPKMVQDRSKWPILGPR